MQWPEKDLIIQATDMAFTLLRDAGFRDPPFNPYSVAARNGILVHESELDDGKTHEIAGQFPTAVVLNSRNPPTRRCFWLAYSIVQSLLPFTDQPQARDADKHKAWMSGATELLMPKDWFREIGEVVQWNLFELRASFALCSHEAISRRITGLTQALVTIYDNGEPSRRFGSPDCRFPEHPQRLELKLYAQAARSGPGWYQAESDSELCQAYFIRPGRDGWQRIILILRPLPNP